MLHLRTFFAALIACLFCTVLHAAAPAPAQPLSIGETWTIHSAALGETRRINVYVPPGAPADTPLPVLYMPDGGLHEDFLHIAGLLQVGAGNGTLRPFILVGIENTERRRDLTGPTDNPEDRKIAPRVGGSAAFRTFIRSELIPQVEQRYRVTRERAIVGESLAGLFVVETWMLEPGLFDSYIAVDPSLWWNHGRLAQQMRTRPPAASAGKLLHIAASADGRPSDGAAFAAGLEQRGLRVSYDEWPGETHATVFHPAALKAFRAAFKPAAVSP